MKKIFKILGWNLIILFILLIFVEIILAHQGYRPGMLDNAYSLKKIKKIKVLEGYTTDSLGIQIITSSVRNYIAQKILNKENNNAKSDININEQYNPVYNLAYDYTSIHLGKHKNEFSKYMSTEGKNDSIIIDYYNSPINSYGFRSIAFEDHQSTKKKILLLGDSFTYGHVTDNKTDSFADVLLTKNHLIYNSGITATDIPQYEAIAKKYIEIIQPDIVIANIYLGNDIAKHYRVVSADVPVFYCTNVGFLNGCSTGVPFSSADSIYNHTLRLASIPQTTFFNRAMSKTRITSFVWAVFGKLRIFGVGPWPNQYTLDFWAGVQKNWDETGYTPNRKYLESIDSICQANQATFITSIIPEHTDFNISRNEVDILLDGYQKYQLKDDYIKSDFTKDDGHFNEEGHEKYANYLDQLIQLEIKK